MRIQHAMAMWLMMSSVALAGSSVTVSWDEFRALYRENIERELTEMTEQEPKERRPLVYSIEEGVYKLIVHADRVEGQVLVTGSVLDGDIVPIPLFGAGMIVSSVGQVSGGTLLRQCGDDRRIELVPSGTNEFQVSLSFLVPVQEDKQSKYVSIEIPHAIRNSLSMEHGGNVTLIEEPGLRGADDLYHFPAGSLLTVRFTDESTRAARAIVEADALNVVRLKDQRAILTTHVVLSQPLPPGSVLDVPESLQLISTSLKHSWMRHQEDGSLVLDIPADTSELRMDFATTSRADQEFALHVPRFRDNKGSDGNILIIEPDDGNIAIQDEALLPRHPVTRLHPRLREVAGRRPNYFSPANGTPIHLTFRRFESVAAPSMVLDAIAFYTTFDENGSALSVLAMDVPATAGARLALHAIPGVEIWSLKVNGKSRQVYSDNAETWIIPLAGSESSRVELALLGKSEKLGLHGRLETTIPETGIPAKHLHVGIALPARVQLLSVEGPVSPAPSSKLRVPSEFIGTPYFFSRAFYKGEGMTLAVSYKEPVREQAQIDD